MQVRSWCLGALGLVVTACGLPSSHAAPALPASGHAQVAPLPWHDGLQYCINLRARDLAPPGSHNVFVHSLSAYLTTNDPNEPAYLALTGRYPGWDTPGTMIYKQPFTNTNTVWLEIIHEFPLGIACIEAYGRGLLPSRYARFDYHMLVSYSYLPRKGPGTSATKLFKVSWGQYLPQFSPRHRPKH
jgi:hypothetical protein